MPTRAFFYTKKFLYLQKKSIYAIMAYELGGNPVRGCRRPINLGANIFEHIIICIVIHFIISIFASQS